ncbi:MAG: glycosyltransferase [Bacteroidota bacterium]|nr:glycosyltransferase [Bacteroidota bacterium]
MNSGKKIVFTVINDLSYDQRMQRICGTLSSHGYDILLVGRLLKSSKPLDEKVYRQKRIKCIFNKGMPFYAEYNIRLFFFLLFNKFDIYGAIDADTILPHALVSNIKGKKLVYDAHEYFTEVPEVTDRKFVKKIWKNIEKLGIKKAVLCYTVASELAKVLSNNLGKQFKVIRNVPFQKHINIDDAYITNKYNRRLIVYQGALNRGRGLEQLIQAMQSIEATLWIIGVGDIEIELRALVKTLNLKDKIIFKGLYKPEELGKLTEEATLGYNVLKNDGLSYYYSLSNKFFDYIQYGTPSISSKFPEYEQILKQYAVGITSEIDPTELSKNINILLSDATLYRQMVTNCMQARKELNWEKESATLIQLFNEIK